jgi:hypothetical protein
VAECEVVEVLVKCVGDWGIVKFGSWVYTAYFMMHESTWHMFNKGYTIEIARNGMRHGI